MEVELSAQGRQIISGVNVIINDTCYIATDEELPHHIRTMAANSMKAAIELENLINISLQEQRCTACRFGGPET